MFSAGGPRIGVLIPCYNDGRYLQRCLNSVFRQTYAPAEVIVVDDGSTDSTPGICSLTASKRDCFRYARQQNAGVSSARNAALEMSTSEFVVFLDADDELLEDALRHYVAAIRSKPSVSWLVAAYQRTDGEVMKGRFIQLPPSRPARFKAYVGGKLRLGNVSNMCFARSAFARMRFPVELRVGEDALVFALLLSLFDPLVISHMTVTAHRRQCSLRNATSLTDRITSKMHDLLFSHPLLPSTYLYFRDYHWAQHCRSVSRAAYREKDYATAVAWYICMLAVNPRYLFDLKMLGWFLRAGICGKVKGIRLMPRY